MIDPLFVPDYWLGLAESVWTYFCLLVSFKWDTCMTRRPGVPERSGILNTISRDSSSLKQCTFTTVHTEKY